ncbi:hypothetical protein AAFC00_003434 [Neodothiora populina]|uniref:Prephenate dehydratase n=1 Tax=Neodothiora populina TaxID=2781224 RepID=A0ABR3PE52_9PEZI
MQPREEIAYLGPNASYTHQAATSAFDPEHHTLLPQTSIEGVFAAVQSGSATYGVVPFENSTNGSVVFTLDLFADQSKKYPDIIVCGERYVEVHHCLLGHPAPANTAASEAYSTSTNNSSGITVNHASSIDDFPEIVHHVREINNSNSADRITAGLSLRSPSSSGHATPIPSDPHPSKSRSQPLTSLSHIRKIYSHPQAWGQCKTFLSCHLKGVERQDVTSTSRAAELVAEDASGTTAAISSGIAASLHKVDFLARDIEDEQDNCTRFLILRRRKKSDDSSSSSASDGLATSSSSSTTNNGEGEGNGNRYKSLITMTLPLISSPLSSNSPATTTTASKGTATTTPIGALVDALAVFKHHSINLTSINPRPSGEAPWHYIFFVEFQGRVGDREVDEALRELRGTLGTMTSTSSSTTSRTGKEGEEEREREQERVKFLGSWENALFLSSPSASLSSSS